MFFFNHLEKLKESAGKTITGRKLATGSNHPIKICILTSRDKDGFDMAAGANLCEVRTEETLKIRIGRCQEF